MVGEDAAKCQAQVQAEGFVECINVASDKSATPWFVQTAQNEIYTNVYPDKTFFPVIFPTKASKSWQLCGQWLQLRVAVRDYKNPLAVNWGQAVRMVRLYDMTKMPTPQYYP